MIQYFQTLVKKNMRIPLVDLTATAKTEKKSILQALERVMKTGDYILSQEVKQFESNYAAYIGTKYCIGVASGSDALLLSMKALGIGEGDEVIVPAMTFIATASSVIHAGAVPVLVDILPDLPLIDPEKIEKSITKNTKAIIPVHMHGYPCPMKEIKVIAKKYNLWIIEDACQAHGSMYKKQKSGTLGDIAAFSFYPSKNLGAYGDAGAVTTSNKRLYEKILMLRHHGQKKKSVHTYLGYNSRLDSLQAAILNVNMRALDKKNQKRRKNAELYRKLLKDLPVTLYKEPEGTQTNYYVFGITVKERDALWYYLRSKSIQCDIHYPKPLHFHPALASLKYKKNDFPNAENFAKYTLSLPMYPELKEDDISYVCKQISRFFMNNHV